MRFSLTMLLEAFMITSALSIDAFVASFAYGGNKIKIPVLSVQIINIICSSTLGISLLAGTLLRQYIPPALSPAICFSILLILGFIKLLDGATKSFIRKNTGFKKKIRFSMFNLKFILSLYADPEKADVDASSVISPAEAASLAVALSLDGLAVGFGAALGNVSVIAMIACSLVVGMLAIISGCFFGNKLAGKIPFNLSWLSGALLIVLAVLKLKG